MVGSSGKKGSSYSGSRNKEALSDYENEEEYRSDEDDDDYEGPGKKGKGSKVPLKKRFDTEKDEGGHDGDGYESDLSYGSDLYKDEEDRSKLQAMTELEREMIFMERSERRDTFLTRSLYIRRKGQSSSAAAPPPVSRARAAIGKTARSRQEDALHKLSAAKAAKQQRQQDIDRDVRKRRGPAGSNSSSEFEEDEEEEESGSGGEEEDGGEGSEEDDDDDDERRAEPLAEFMEPFFEDLVVGCLVRLGIGMSPTGQSVYRVCEIVGVDSKDPSKQYKFEGRMTHKWLDCKWGEHRARWQLARVSDKEPQRHEVDEWLREIDRASMPRMTKAAVAAKKKALGDVSAYKYTADAVKQMLQEKRLASSRPKVVAVERDRLSKELSMAQDRGDDKEIERLKQEMTELDAYSMKSQTKNKRAVNLSKMNKRNREENFKTIADVVQGAAKLGEAGYDPFSRRWTRSQNYYKKPLKEDIVELQFTGGGEDEGADGDDAGGTVKVIATMGDGDKKVVALGEKEAQELADRIALAAGKPPGEGLDGGGGNGGAVFGSTAPVDWRTSVELRHAFDLPINLQALKQWGGAAGASQAYLARKRQQEAVCGVQLPKSDGKRHLLVLTVNDYKRRRGLL
eukprot:jgi/Mesen1/628/ME000108S10788